MKLYSITGDLLRSIDLRPELHSAGVSSLDMAYSELEDRVGVLNNDYTMSFWDVNDDFKFEKIINPQSDDLFTQSILSGNNVSLHSSIYYINHIGTWLTIDQKSQIFLWDIEEEKADLLPQRHKGMILNVCEITHQKMVVFSTLMQQLCFWNLTMRVLIKIIKLDSLSIHSM